MSEQGREKKVEQRCDERGLLMLPHVDAHTDVRTQAATAEQKTQPSPGFRRSTESITDKETDSGATGAI